MWLKDSIEISLVRPVFMARISLLLDVVFCLACRHFGAGVGEPSNTLGGFQN